MSEVIEKVRECKSPYELDRIENYVSDNFYSYTTKELEIFQVEFEKRVNEFAKMVADHLRTKGPIDLLMSNVCWN